MNTKMILSMAVLIMAASAIVMSTDAEQSDAEGNYGSYDNPYSSISMSFREWDTNYGGVRWAYLENGSSVNLTSTTYNNTDYYATSIEYSNGEYYLVDINGVTGLTINNGTVTGTVSVSYDTLRVNYSVVGKPSYTTYMNIGVVPIIQTYTMYANIDPSNYYYGSVYIHNNTTGTSSDTTSSSLQVSLVVSQGDSVSFIATPFQGYSFVSWTSNWTSQVFYSATQTITATSNESFIANFSAIPTYTVTIQSQSGGYATASDGVNTITATSGGTTVSMTVYSGTSVTFTATVIDPEIEFYYWSNGLGVLLYQDNPKTLTITSNTTLIANWAYPECTVTFDATTNGGILIGSATKTLRYGDQYGELPSATKSGYSFAGWFTESSGGTQIYSNSIFQSATNQILYAQYSAETPVTGDVYWNNGLYNGSIDMVFQYKPNQNYPHTMNMPLYTGTTTNNITIWSLSGYTLEITTSYPALYVTATLKFDESVVSSNTICTGSWSTFQLTIDTAEGKLEVTPVNRFTSFIDYTLYDSQKRTVLDWSNTVKGLTVYEIAHTDDTSSGSNAVRFSVTSTQVFLETYGIVLNNPSINVYDYFPQYESVRLNMYSFAIYGDTFSVNGQTYPLDGANVTIYYVNDSSGNHYLPAAYPNEPVRTKTMELSNIYVSWDALTGHCSLTFANDRFTIDLGTYSPVNETVSFTGMWYFATAIYSGKDTTQKELGPWKMLPDLDKNQMLIIFLGVLTVIGVAAHIKLEAGIFDLIIIGLAALVAFLLLG